MKQPIKRATITDVASKAGVSKQTISRVINGSALVSEATRIRVQSVIDELGYRRSELARTLTCGRSHTIAIVGDNVSFFGSDSYAGFARLAETSRYALIPKELPLDADRDMALAVIHSVLDRQVDGILWAVPDTGDGCPWLSADFLRQITVPIVFMNAPPRPGLNVVGYDNFSGAQLAVRHLIEGGRRHIAHISGALNGWYVHERKRGWLETLRDAGLPHAEHQFVEGNWYPESGCRSFQKLLNDFPEMDAVFVAGDYMCLGVFLEAHRRGIRIPEDVAVVGFGNRMGSDFYYPPLTTVEQNKRSQGEAAFRKLIAGIEQHFNGTPDMEKATNELNHSLLIRESA